MSDPDGETREIDSSLSSRGRSAEERTSSRSGSSARAPPRASLRRDHPPSATSSPSGSPSTARSRASPRRASSSCASRSTWQARPGRRSAVPHLPPGGDRHPFLDVDPRRHPGVVGESSPLDGCRRNDHGQSLLRRDRSDDARRNAPAPARPPDPERRARRPGRTGSELARPHPVDLGGVLRHAPRRDILRLPERRAGGRGCRRRLAAGGPLVCLHGDRGDPDLQRDFSFAPLGRPRPPARPVHPPGQDRRRRHGRRLPRRARDAAASDGDQAAAPAQRRGNEPAALRARGAAHGAPGQSPHRHDLRLRAHAGGVLLLRDGVPRRAGPRASGQGDRAASRRPGRAHPAAGVRVARRGARRRPHPPRHQAGEHPAQRDGRHLRLREGRGFRSRQRRHRLGGREADPRGRHRRDAPVPRAGDDPGRHLLRSAERPLFSRRRGVLPPDWLSSVRRTAGPGDPEPAQRDSRGSVGPSRPPRASEARGPDPRMSREGPRPRPASAKELLDRLSALDDVPPWDAAEARRWWRGRKTA